VRFYDSLCHRGKEQTVLELPHLTQSLGQRDRGWSESFLREDVDVDNQRRGRPARARRLNSTDEVRKVWRHADQIMVHKSGYRCALHHSRIPSKKIVDIRVGCRQLNPVNEANAKP